MSADLTISDRTKLLTDLADTVEVDRRARNPVYSDRVLEALLPSFCTPDLSPFVLTQLFLLMADERAAMVHGDVSEHAQDVARENAAFYLNRLIFGAAEAKAS